MKKCNFCGQWTKESCDKSNFRGCENLTGNKKETEKTSKEDGTNTGTDDSKTE